jgi:hypothetical protein
MEPSNDIFKVEISEDGVGYFHKSRKVIIVCFWLGIIANFLLAYPGVYLLIKRGRSINFSSPSDQLLLAGLFYITIFSIAYFLQFLFFLKFIRQSGKAIQMNDSFSYNRSLKWMYRAFWMTAIGIIINIIYALQTILIYGMT